MDTNTNMPQVEVKLFATLRRYVNGKTTVEVPIDVGQTIEQVLEHLGVPVEETRIIFLNNRAAELSQPLVGGEQLGIFPAIGGG